MTDQSLGLLAAPWLAGGLAGSALTLISQWAHPLPAAASAKNRISG